MEKGLTELVSCLSQSNGIAMVDYWLFFIEMNNVFVQNIRAYNVRDSFTEYLSSTQAHDLISWHKTTTTMGSVFATI